MMYLPAVLIAVILLCGLTDVALGAFAGWHVAAPAPEYGQDAPMQP